jgi:transcription antitermination factor NusG
VVRAAAWLFTAEAYSDFTAGENVSKSPVYTSSVPLLPREADHFPEDVFGLSLAEFPWGVAHVMSRAEKALARHLAALQVPFYLPLGERQVRRGGRSFTSYIPFFPGYVFLRGNATSRAKVIRDNLVVRLLDVPDQALLDVELRQLRDLQKAGAPLIPFPWLGPGDAVRIQEGPFRGYLGVVAREKGAQRLVVSVSMLRRSVAVELGREALAPVPGVSARAAEERHARAAGPGE